MKNIIFDFDGTLANSLPLVVNIAEELLKIQITDQDIKKYRNMPAKEVLKQSKVPIYKIPGFLVKGKALMIKRMHEVEIFPDLSKVVKTIAKDHKLYVVSSNSLGIINAFLAQNQIESYFSGLYGNVGLFSKAQALKKVIKREQIPEDDVVYIGDEVRDIEASKKINMPIISVVWGYNGEQILKSYKPNYLASKPSDILNFIKNI
jgi:phosphoglycolate phosphatase